MFTLRIPYYTAFPWRLAAFYEVHYFLVGAWLGCYKSVYDVMGRMNFRLASGTLQSSCRYLLACYLMLAWPGEVVWRWSEVAIVVGIAWSWWVKICSVLFINIPREIAVFAKSPYGHLR